MFTAAAFILSATAYGQVFGTVRVAVHDPQNLVVPNAAVSVKAVGSSWSQTAMSNTAGDAVFLAVPGSGEITPIGYGVMAEEELAERIYTITQTRPGQSF